MPAVFPATQFYYVSTALPAITSKPLAAALLALPVPLGTPLVVCALAIREVLQRQRGSIGHSTQTPEARSASDG